MNQSRILTSLSHFDQERWAKKQNYLMILSLLSFLTPPPQLVMAGCLCRPVVVMGGLWVGVLVLVQAVLTLRASTHAAQPIPSSHSAHAL